MNAKELHAYLVKHDLYKNPAARIKAETEILFHEKLPPFPTGKRTGGNGPGHWTE
jgi:hypothetical protein